MSNMKPECDTLLPGRKPVLEQLLEHPEKVDTVYFQKNLRAPEISQIVDVCKTARIRCRALSREELARVFPGRHQGVVARVFTPGFLDLEDLLDRALSSPLPLLLALDQVQDPGNAGVLARTMYALGFAGLIVPKNRSAYLGAAAQKASAGALSRLPVTRVVNLSRALTRCVERGHTVYCAQAGREGENIFKASLSMPAVLVLGGEEKGIRPNVVKRCGKKIFIPMPGGFDSLNVAQAGAVILGQFARLKNKPRLP
ncbi:MAG: RNA methyltransferase [Thermodesulfobacteriota bacterium]|nr:RNA methyltransferase [Thermodesulfobacteriota bacterium]